MSKRNREFYDHVYKFVFFTKNVEALLFHFPPYLPYHPLQSRVSYFLANFTLSSIEFLKCLRNLLGWLTLDF